MKQSVYTRQYTDWSRVPLFLSLSDTCILLGITEETAVSMIKKGEIAGNKCGREWRISKKSILAYIEGDSESSNINDSSELAVVSDELLVRLAKHLIESIKQGSEKDA